MDYKQEGDKITPIMQPVPSKRIKPRLILDPNGPWGSQAKQGIEQLKQMGLGIETKEKVTKPVKH